ncbi:NCS1 family nucleobase:cation symporter-1 [Nocardia puris]|uniref:NCS1 family nucleobase:cation symporter-1 n=1 Tax=Nocardia puris TaxID=208602 RepID=A0A366DBD1_9NOCA|nr:NCS1 family nucleobase:cation symporter-1 [Nocardia puris]MBF6214051.1 NCS1 family nucleobase:cation symporter-1 [Nocardia puris]MBF6368665.1 NCS1 family nucleobase:cation symporter-1 [Nocardia puris]RBO86558.1 NCS1 family nucleobase:cation symporter-1 [Nocardia puris]
MTETRVRPPGGAPGSSTLVNDDLAPTTKETATWRTWDIFCLWMTSAHSIASYGFAVGMLALGMTGWQTMLALFVGVLILWLGSNLVGVAGQKVGVPFPVFARAAFGVFGANVPALLRAVVAVFWYGIQTYLASTALMILLLRVWPGLASWTESSFLGLSALGWIAFLVLWTVQLAIINYGMEVVRKASDFAGPVVWIGMIALAIWILGKADWSIDFNARAGEPLSGGATVAAFVGVAFLMVSFMAGPLVNYADFARFSPSKKAVLRGNAWGIPFNETAFVVLSIVISLATLKVYGEVLHDPVALVAEIDNDAIVMIAAVLFATATVGINVVLNFVSPAYDISNAAPKYISFRTGGIITAVLSIVVLPWKLWENQDFIIYFLGGVGALMGPVFGILVVDYYLVRRQRTAVGDLYSDHPEGSYWYTRGFNPKALIALGISGTIAVIVALAPDSQTITALSWPVGAALGAAIMYGLNVKRPVSTP